MNKFAVLVLAGAVAGCASVGDVEDLKGRLEGLEAIVSNSDKAVAGAVQHMERLERDLRAVEFRLADVHRRMDSLQPPSRPTVNVEDAMRLIENNKSLAPEVRDRIVAYFKALADKTPEKAFEEAATLPAELAVPQLVFVLKEPDSPRRRNARYVLTRWKPSEAAPLMEKALTDGLVRNEILRIFNEMPPHEEIRKALEAHKNDGVDVWKVSVAEALARAQSKEGVRLLIQYLYSEESSIRSVAIEALKATTTFDMGFKPFAGKDDRQAAAEKWENWWKENETAFVFPKR